MFLELERDHPGGRLEVVVEPGRAQPDAVVQLLDRERDDPGLLGRLDEPNEPERGVEEVLAQRAHLERERL